MQFESVSDLAKLAYFQIENGKLRLKSGVVDKVIDTHTHLGWSFLLGKRLDLWGEYPLKHFFPETDNAFDLDHHVMIDLSRKNRWYCRREVIRGVVNTKGYSRTHTIPNLLNEMDAMQISKAVILAVDWPKISANTDNVVKSINKKKISQERLIPFMSLHPAMRGKEQRLNACCGRGVRGIKLHPQMQLFRLKSRLSQSIFRIAGEHHLPILIHTGHSPLMTRWQRRYGKVSDLKKIVEKWPKTTLIMGHTGLDDYEEMINLANTHELVYLELSSQSTSHIKTIIEKTDSTKILYGSDWPFYPMAIQMARLLLATEGKLKRYRSTILFENAHRLLNL